MHVIAIRSLSWMWVSACLRLLGRARPALAQNTSPAPANSATPATQAADATFRLGEIV